MGVTDLLFSAFPPGGPGQCRALSRPCSAATLGPLPAAAQKAAQTTGADSQATAPGSPRQSVLPGAPGNRHPLKNLCH